MSPATDVDTVWDRLERALAQDPATGFNAAVEACGRYAGESGRVAMVVRHADDSREVWTHAELDQHAARLARTFWRMGLKRGDRVAGLLTRQVETWITALAAWRSGLVYVPLFGGFAPDAIAWRLDVSGARAVVVAHRYVESVNAARNLLEADVAVLVVGSRTGLTRADGDLDFWTELNASTPDGPQADTAATDLATLMFTSGTSGTPKACMIPHSGVLSVIGFARCALAAGPGNVLFSTADPGWTFGLYTTGSAVLAVGSPRVTYTGDFDPDRWFEVVESERVRTLATAPSALQRLSHTAESRGVPTSLQTVLTAGEPLVTDVARNWERTGAPPVQDGYGLSEVGMVLSDLAEPRTPTVAGSIAGPVPGFDVRIVTRTGADVAPGEIGLVAVHRPRYQLSIGYENVPDQWAAHWQDDLFVTEDRAFVGEDGRWHIVGRDDDMIIASGYNISPVEVENAAGQHPAVAEVAAVAGQDPGRGTIVRLCVVRRTYGIDDDQLISELRELVRAKVGPFATPRQIVFLEQLPRTEVGKLRRAALRD